MQPYASFKFRRLRTSFTMFRSRFPLSATAQPGAGDPGGQKLLHVRSLGFDRFACQLLDSEVELTLDPRRTAPKPRVS